MMVNQPESSTAQLAETAADRHEPDFQSLGHLSSLAMVELRPVVAAESTQTRRQIFDLVKDLPDRTPNPLDLLSLAGLDAMGLLTLGFNNADIANRLFITESAVKFNAVSAFDKLDTNNRLKAANICRSAGIFTYAIDEKRTSSFRGSVLAATRKALTEIDFEPDGTPSPLGRLTARQSEVVDLSYLGLSNKEISEAMGVAVQTVKYHKQLTYSRLGLDSSGTSLSHFVAFARKGKIIKRASAPMPERQNRVVLVDSRTQHIKDLLDRETGLALDELQQTGKLTGEYDSHDMSVKTAVLQKLHSIGAVTTEMVEQGWIDLPAALLTTLAETPATKDIATQPSWRGLALEAVKKHAGLYISQARQQSARV